MDFQDEPKMQFRWEYDRIDFPDTLKVNEFVNDQLMTVYEMREDVLLKGAVAVLRAKGYIVVEPEAQNGDVLADEGERTE